MEESGSWKNLNSFVARITAADFAPWMTFPIWQLRIALEDTPVEGPAMDCRIWVASEWMIRCAEVILEDMSSGEQLDENSRRSLRTGPLCSCEVLTVARFDFWRQRFSELAAANDLGLDEPLLRRIGEALERMNAVRNAGSSVSKGT
jgi:hypothetical protein